MKRIFAFLLAVLSMMLVACGNEPQVATPDTPTVAATADQPEQPTTVATEPPTTLANDRFDPEASADILGSWTVTAVMDGTMFNLTDMEESVEMTLIYCLNGDGTYYRGVKSEEYQAAIAAFGAAVENHMLDRLRAKFIAENLEAHGKKKAEALWEENQKAADEEQTKRFVEDLHLDYRFSQLNSEGDYYVENDAIWFSKGDGTYERCGYSVSEEGLTITEMENPRMYSQLKLTLPLLLTKA